MNSKRFLALSLLVLGRSDASVDEDNNLRGPIDGRNNERQLQGQGQGNPPMNPAEVQDQMDALWVAVNDINKTVDDFHVELQTDIIVDTVDEQYQLDPHGYTKLNNIEVTGVSNLDTVNVAHVVSGPSMIANTIRAVRFIDFDDPNFRLHLSDLSLLNQVSVHDLSVVNSVAVAGDAMFIANTGDLTVKNEVKAPHFATPEISVGSDDLVGFQVSDTYGSYHSSIGYMTGLTGYGIGRLKRAITFTVPDVCDACDGWVWRKSADGLDDRYPMALDGHGNLYVKGLVDSSSVHASYVHADKFKTKDANDNYSLDPSYVSLVNQLGANEIWITTSPGDLNTKIMYEKNLSFGDVTEGMTFRTKYVAPEDGIGGYLWKSSTTPLMELSKDGKLKVGTSLFVGDTDILAVINSIRRDRYLVNNDQQNEEVKILKNKVDVLETQVAELKEQAAKADALEKQFANLKLILDGMNSLS